MVNKLNAIIQYLAYILTKEQMVKFCRKIRQRILSQNIPSNYLIFAIGKLCCWLLVY